MQNVLYMHFVLGALNPSINCVMSIQFRFCGALWSLVAVGYIQLFASVELIESKMVLVAV